MAQLSSQRILVTGASGALGSRVARLLSEHGARLVLTGRDDQRLQAHGAGAELLSVDLEQPGASAALIEAVTADGELDGIVLAHGVVAFGPVTELTTETLRRLTTLNETTPIELIVAAAPHLSASKARGNEPFVVTMSGVIADMPTVGMAAYGATKSALKAFVNVAQRELRREGIRVLDVRPPHTETGLASRAIAGVAPTMPTGLDPEVVAQRIVSAIVNDEKDVPATEFG